MAFGNITLLYVVSLALVAFGILHSFGVIKEVWGIKIKSAPVWFYKLAYTVIYGVLGVGLMMLAVSIAEGMIK